MNFRHYNKSDIRVIVELFASVFAASEGIAEGELIGGLSKDMFEKTYKKDLLNFVALDSDKIIGSIFFSRLVFDSDIEAFILGPVAVHNDYQGKGVGKALINFGLDDLKNRGVDIALTYGDPRFYNKVGFYHVSQKTIKAPFDLSQPEGWLAQSFNEETIKTFTGKCTCVKALRDPAYW
ncbi:MAG: N-acetyltransferase [Magnetococcales bacterium]|nr:N-acetyltransferase [Magnetococcales bacterium]